MNKVGGRKGKLRKTERQKDSKLYHLSETVSEKSFPWFPMMETVAYTAGAEMQSRLVALVGTGN